MKPCRLTAIEGLLTDSSFRFKPGTARDTSVESLMGSSIVDGTSIVGIQVCDREGKDNDPINIESTELVPDITTEIGFKIGIT